MSAGAKEHVPANVSYGANDTYAERPETKGIEVEISGTDPIKQSRLEEAEDEERGEIFKSDEVSDRTPERAMVTTNEAKLATERSITERSKQMECDQLEEAEKTSCNSLTVDGALDSLAEYAQYARKSEFQPSRRKSLPSCSLMRDVERNVRTTIEATDVPPGDDHEEPRESISLGLGQEHTVATMTCLQCVESKQGRRWKKKSLRIEKVEALSDAFLTKALH
ncbi:hypothetical protein PInf_003241 [Phytophthora infestans]|nr:hypothetical protein PInf_003241 [Phytophthora infestans]